MHSSNMYYSLVALEHNYTQICFKTYVKRSKILNWLEKKIENKVLQKD